MWSNLSFSSLASSLTDLSTTVTTTVTSTATNLTNTAANFIEDQKRSYEQEQAKIEQKKKQQTYDSTHTPPPALPLWHTFTEQHSVLEAELRQRILRLATDPRTFLSQAPDAALFPFSLQLALPHIQRALQSDALLARMQYRLVPRKVSERQFWTNYMYRVSMVREQMGVGELFEVGRVEAEVERERSREERLKAQEEGIEKDRKERQERSKGALKTDVATATGATSSANDKVERKQQEENSKQDNTTHTTQHPTPSTTTTTTTTSHTTPPTKPVPPPAASQRRDSVPDEEEFVSDEYVHVASQDVVLRKELGLAQPTRAAGAAAAGQGVGGKGVVGGSGGVSGGGVGEAELDELESMLADADVNDDGTAAGGDDARDELLEELEGELTDERNLP